MRLSADTRCGNPFFQDDCHNSVCQDAPPEPWYSSRICMVGWFYGRTSPVATIVPPALHLFITITALSRHHQPLYVIFPCLHTPHKKFKRHTVAPTLLRNEPFGENVEGLFARNRGIPLPTSEFNQRRLWQGFFFQLSVSPFDLRCYRSSNY
jgi:hypothetical protein